MLSLLGIAMDAAVLMLLIKTVSDEEIGMGTAFLLALITSIATTALAIALRALIGIAGIAVAAVLAAGLLGLAIAGYFGVELKRSLAVAGIFGRNR